MRQSESTKLIAGALAKAQQSMGAAHKSGTNTHFGSAYAKLEDYVTIAVPALTDQGIALVQSPSLTRDGDVFLVTVTTTLLHTSGEWISGDFSIPCAVIDPQKVVGSVTYARRASIAAFVSMAAADDEDGENLVDHQAPAKTLPNRLTGPAAPTPDRARTGQGIYVDSVEVRETKAGPQFRVAFSDGVQASTLKDAIGMLAEQYKADGLPVRYETKMNGRWCNLIAITRDTPPADAEDIFVDEVVAPDQDEIPF